MNDGELAGSCPGEDVARLRHDGVGASSAINHAEICSTEFPETGDGEGTGCAVAKDADDGNALKLELGYAGSVAEDVVEFFGCAFGVCGLEDSDLLFGDFYTDSWLVSLQVRWWGKGG